MNARASLSYSSLCIHASTLSKSCSHASPPSVSSRSLDGHSNSAEANRFGLQNDKVNAIQHHVSYAHDPVKFPPLISTDPVANFPADIAVLLEKDLIPTIQNNTYRAQILHPGEPNFHVCEYPIGDNWVIWDIHSGLVYLTGIWRAALEALKVNDEYWTKSQLLPRFKVNLVQLMQTAPKNMHSSIRRVRGGNVKIQGTWLPYQLCKILASRFCYHIRYNLVPVFGPDFPKSCLHPSQEGFGVLCFARDQFGQRVAPHNSICTNVPGIPSPVLKCFLGAQRTGDRFVRQSMTLAPRHDEAMSKLALRELCANQRVDKKKEATGLLMWKKNKTKLDFVKTNVPICLPQTDHSDTNKMLIRNLLC